MQNNKALQDAMASCYLPFSQENFLELGFQAFLTPESAPSSILITAPFPIHFYYKEIHRQLKNNLASPLRDIDIECQQKIRSHQTQLPGKMLRGAKNVIAIASGKGGVGKSTIAVNLAISLARAGARVGLLDADIYGPSVPLMLGIRSKPEFKNDLYVPVSKHGIEVMSIGLLTDDQPALIWRGPMLAKSLLQMMNLTAWENLDYLFIDLPPGTGDIQLSLVQKIPLTAAVIVSTPQQVATHDAQKGIKMFQKTNIAVLGIIENMAKHHCPQCGYEDDIFGQQGVKSLCQEFDLTMLGQLPLDKQIQQACDSGSPSAISHNNPQADIFMEIALKTAIKVSRRPLNYTDNLPPVICE